MGFVFGFIYSNCFLSTAFGSRHGVSGRYPIPKFMETDTNLTASAGDRVVLVCRVENLGTREVRNKSMLHRRFFIIIIKFIFILLNFIFLFWRFELSFCIYDSYNGYETSSYKNLS